MTYIVIRLHITNVFTKDNESERRDIQNHLMVNVDLSHQKYSTYHKIQYASKKNGKIA